MTGFEAIGDLRWRLEFAVIAEAVVDKAANHMGHRFVV